MFSLFLSTLCSTVCCPVHSQLSLFFKVQQVMAALSVIGVNCVNAKRVVDKAAEFINTLEMRSKSPFLKGCLQKLAILAGDEKVLEAAAKEGRRGETKDS